MRTKTHTTPPATIDEYLARVSPDKRAALEQLRATIRAVVPTAEECISVEPFLRADDASMTLIG